MQKQKKAKAAKGEAADEGKAGTAVKVQKKPEDEEAE